MPQTWGIFNLRLCSHELLCTGTKWRKQPFHSLNFEDFTGINVQESTRVFWGEIILIFVNFTLFIFRQADMATIWLTYNFLNVLNADKLWNPYY